MWNKKQAVARIRNPGEAKHYMNPNLEALIEDHSKIMADQMVKAAARAGSEEDIRHACNTLIDEFIKTAGLTVQGRHEYGLAGGRIDPNTAG